MRSLPTEADVMRAIAWRLEGVPAEIVKDGLLAATTLLVRHIPIRDDERLVADVLARLESKEDRRKPWSLLCALIALVSHHRHQYLTFWPAGTELLKDYAQAKRSPEKAVDGLSMLIEAHLMTQPDVSPTELFDSLADQASMGFDKTLADYEPASDALVFSPAPGRELTTINRSAFIRRVQRIRGKLPQFSSHSA